MMQLIRDTDHPGLTIQSYEPKRLVINETLYSESVILTPDSIEPWPPKTFEAITVEHIQQLANHNPDVVLLGTGDTQLFPPDALLQPLIQKNLSVEIMTTLSACYTFKILVTEGRAVVAGFIV